MPKVGIMSELVDISELDCIFLSYKESNADSNWSYVRSFVPWAKRVDGVRGSDAAHKAAAAKSDTERFILIDADNQPNPEFFNQQLRINQTNDSCVFRWRAKNIINGLCYGNGGISSWTKTFVNNMRTHEASNGDNKTVVEFCFDDKYWAMHDVWSTTIPNGSPQQAWQAGFREGVKLCLDRGRRVNPEEFESSTWFGNRTNLVIWCSIGADVEYGKYAMLGARQGAYKTMFDDDWDYTEVRDFDKLENIWNDSLEYGDKESETFARMLRKRLNLDIVTFNTEQSKWFKNHQRTYQNIDIMLPERDVGNVIRSAARQLW
jgi:hypothetical protein